VLYREIVARGYQGGQSQLRAFMRTLRPAQPAEPVVRFETAMGEQLQVDWVEFRKGPCSNAIPYIVRTRDYAALS